MSNLPNAFIAFTIANRLYQFVALRREGNFAPSLAGKLSLHSAALNLQLEFQGNIKEFISKFKEPGYEQPYENLFSSETVKLNFGNLFVLSYFFICKKKKK